MCPCNAARTCCKAGYLASSSSISCGLSAGLDSRRELAAVSSIAVICPRAGWDSRVISNRSEVMGMMLHAAAMFFAVPTLSPVRIQTLIPAVRRSARTSGTPSCSLSSMAVAPTNSSSLSASACSVEIALGCPFFSFLTSSAFAVALRYFACHEAKSGSSRRAHTSVRSAASAQSPSWPSIERSSSGSAYLESLARSAKTTESAPLQ
mmetsp:Transcript_43289/g.105147  ORF Transcript_43289/g.105147 Transcript_43289/m.105147 type:complete len:207 (+) Transcript_43289:2498-3118(+)